jgi:hypothetical protein
LSGLLVIGMLPHCGGIDSSTPKPSSGPWVPSSSTVVSVSTPAGGGGRVVAVVAPVTSRWCPLPSPCSASTAPIVPAASTNVTDRLAGSASGADAARSG